MKSVGDDSTKDRLLQAAEVSDTAVDPINFKAATGSLKHSPNGRKENV